MIRTRKYRLYPNKEQKEKLEKTLETCRFLYNCALQERRESFKQRKMVSFYQQAKELAGCRQEFPEIAEVNRQVEIDVLARIDIAFRVFFTKIKRGQKAGLPRYRGQGRYDSFTYPSQWTLYADRVKLCKLGTIKFRPKIPDFETMDGRNCTILRELNKWYVYFTYGIEDVEKKPINQDSLIGIDLGTNSFITLSNGEKIENPKFFENAQKQLKFRQQRLSRRKKGSKRRAKARLLVAKMHQKIRNQRYDFHHKISRKLVDKYDVIGYEDLQINRMTEGSYYARSINDAGWCKFIGMLYYKAEEAGKHIIPINPAYTSQACSECGSINSLQISERMYVCKKCGLVEDRDINAAINILQKAINWLGANHRGEGDYKFDETRSV